MQVNGGGRYGVSEAMVSQFVMQAAGGVGVGVGIGGARGLSHITSSPVLFSHHDSFQEEPNMVSHEEQQQQIGLGFGLPVGSNDRQPGASKDVNEDASEDASEDGEDDEEGRGVAKIGMGGNRWPRDQTLALLKIRADMDSTFREAPAKTPLWEDISRKLGELGYHRSAKKCKEKFENVHKYYKRTKEGRAGRQDGKNYRFFTQLEALYSKTNLNSNVNPTNNTNTNTNTNTNINTNINTDTNTNTNTNTDIDTNISMKNAVAMDSSHDNPPQQEATWGKSSSSFYDSRTAFGAPKISTSSLGERFVSSTSRILSSPLDLSSSSATEDDYNNEKQEKKRKRRSRSKSSKKMAHLFELVMKKLIRKQEKLQMKFLHALDRREKERLIREEAWKMQEMARLERELELKSQESAMAASRDAALTAFLQSFPHALTSGVVDPVTTTATTTTNTTITTSSDVIIHPPPSAMVPPPSNDEAKLHSLVYNSTSNKRWPKAEVLALIQLRTNMECRFQEPGPKGRIWKEISMNMSALGFNRSPNRCKEKWENINKYFKKNKDSSKKRSENSKTCPYFFQLDALYRKGLLGSSTRLKLLTNQSQEVEEEPSRSEEGGSNNNGEDVIAIKSVQEQVNIATKAAIGLDIQTNNSEDAIQTPVKEALPTNMKSKEAQTNAEAVQLAEDL